MAIDDLDEGVQLTFNLLQLLRLLLNLGAMAPETKKTQGWFTLWLCQNSYWKWPFMVSFPIKNGDFP